MANQKADDESTNAVGLSGWGRLRLITVLAAFSYLFFLAIGLIGQGMKASFREPLQAFLSDGGGRFSELSSFATGIMGTALVQSSSSVTSMAVVLTQEGVLPLIIAIGIAHGANLGTSVTSTIVAFAAEARHGAGSVLDRTRRALFAPRGQAFRRAAGVAVVHDMFNILMVTGILLAFELPFGLVRRAAAATAGLLGPVSSAGSGAFSAFSWLAPGTYTKPITSGLLDLGVPGWVLAILGLPLLFLALRGFSRRMRARVLSRVGATGAQGSERRYARALGRRLLGDSAMGAFARGLILTILIQSSSATTSMVVPLAALGFFSVRQIFPFILGANIGTTTTAILAGLGGFGDVGFHAGMTIALSHFYLNTLAVVLVLTVPGLSKSILGSAQWLAASAARRPFVLVLYVVTLAVIAPVLIFVLPVEVSIALLGALLTLLLIGPRLYLRRRGLGVPRPRDSGATGTGAPAGGPTAP